MRLFFVIGFFFSLVLPATGQCVLVAADESGRTPVPSARMRLYDSSQSFVVQTDMNGIARIPEEYAKQIHTLRLDLESPGYRPETARIVACGDTVFLRISENELNPVVITDQLGRSDARTSAFRISVIDEARIKRLGAQDLRDVLQQELNMRISQDQVLGPALSFKGLSGEHIKFMIDGVPVIGRLNGSVDLSQLNVNDVERIEIVDGPMSSQFGSNALAATINIITRKRSAYRNRFSFRSYNESAGNFNQELQWNRRLGERGFANIALVRNDFDGWSAGEDWTEAFRKGKADSSRVKAWSPREQYIGRITYGREGTRWTWNARTEGFYDFILKRGFPRAPYNEQAFDDRYRTWRLDQAVNVSYRWNENWNTQMTSGFNYYQRIKNTYITELTGVDQSLSDSPGSQDTTVFRNLMSRWITQYASGGGRVKGLLGLDMNMEDASGDRVSEAPVMSDFSGFGELEYRLLNRLKARGALRYGVNSMFDVPLIPSAHLVYFQGNHVLKGSYAKGFRAPAIKELYFYFVDINHNIVGNRDLDSEESQTLQLNYEYARQYDDFGWKAEFSLFDNRIQRMITLAQVSNVEYSYINVGRFRSQGINALVSVNASRWTARAGYSYVGRTSDLLNGTLMPWLYTHEINGSASYHYNRRWSVHSFIKFSGKLPGYSVTESGSIVESYLDHYSLWDMNVGYRSLNERVSLSFGVKNLLNVTSVRNGVQTGGVHSSGGFASPVAMGRLYFIQCIIQWKK